MWKTFEVPLSPCDNAQELRSLNDGTCRLHTLRREAKTIQGINGLELFLLMIYHTKKSHNLSIRCVRNRLVASLSTMLLFYQVATRLLLRTC
jgi:hypothetical protein